jgi:hypothetical protein
MEGKMPDKRLRRIVRTSGKVEVFNDPLSMRRIRKMLGADALDTVILLDGMVMLVDDQGHKKQLEINTVGTALYLKRCKAGTTHFIVGDVAIVPDSDFAETKYDHTDNA